jgi:type IV pilus assembly protein PilN
MMIRINLLPVRQVKKREMGRQILVLFAALLALAGVLNFLWYSGRQSVKDNAQARIDRTTAEIASLEKSIGEVNNINKRKKEVEDKLKVLADLKKSRSGPVRLLDALSTAMPKKVWIHEWDEKANNVKIAGKALSHDDVAELMRSLNDVVWTPQGMGKLVEQRRDSKTSRVELLTGTGAIMEFPNTDIGQFFTNIELKRAEQRETTSSTPRSSMPSKTIEFEIALNANYAV